jgi:arylsulfatase A-like enzyme
MKAFTILLATAGLSLAAPKPNFLIIYTDDQGYGDVSTYHDSDCQTPNIDRLAAEGMLFTDMRANCTVCSPSRAALMTGKYADRVGVPGVIRTSKDSSWGYFDPSVPTLADKLGEAGYQTALIGKWHLGLEPENHPNKRGFDLFHGFLGDMMDSYMNHRRGGINFMRKNAETIDPKGHATNLFAEWAADYLEEKAEEKGKPFFLYLAFNAPHFPIEPPAEWLKKVKERAPNIKGPRAKNVAFVEHLDDRIGHVLAALKKSGLEENTVVIFTSDNGGSLPHAQNNDPWRDGKQSHFDGGLRVPFSAKWPGHIKAGTRSDYSGLTFDIFPTFLEIAGVAPAAELDARSLLPVLTGKGQDTTGRDLYFIRREGGAVHKGEAYEAVVKDGWKVMRNNPFAPFELYDLSKDPSETKNLAETEKSKLEELIAIMQKHLARGAETPWRKPGT